MHTATIKNHSTLVDEVPSLRILQLASGDLWAGAEVMVYNLAVELNASAKVSLQVVLLNDGELASRLRQAGVAVTVLDESRLGFFHLLKRLVQLDRQFQPHVIHTHRRKENILGACASLSRRGCRSIRTVHGDEEHPPRWYQLPQRLVRLADRLAGRFLQEKVVAVSDELAERLSHRYGSSRVVTIFNGIDPQAVRDRADAAENPFTEDENRFRVALVGRMVPVKRVDLFLQTAALAEQQGEKGFAFYVIGDGPQLAAMKQMAEQLKLHSVQFLGYRDNTPAYLQRMDALCVTSDHEGLPMVVLEAFSLGLPVVARTVGGLADLLDHGHAGLLVKSADPAEFIVNLKRLADNDSLSNAIAVRARNLLMQQYSQTVMARRYVELCLLIVPSRMIKNGSTE